VARKQVCAHEGVANVVIKKLRYLRACVDFWERSDETLVEMLDRFLAYGSSKAERGSVISATAEEIADLVTLENWVDLFAIHGKKPGNPPQANVCGGVAKSGGIA